MARELSSGFLLDSPLRAFSSVRRDVVQSAVLLMLIQI